MCVNHIPPVRCSDGGHWGGFHSLSMVKSAAVSTEMLTWNPLGSSSVLGFFSSCIWFSQQPRLVSTLTSICFCFLNVTIPPGVRWNPCVVQICSSLVASDAEHFHALLAMLAHLFENRPLLLGYLSIESFDIFLNFLNYWCLLDTDHLPGVQMTAILCGPALQLTDSFALQNSICQLLTVLHVCSMQFNCQPDTI